jgi:hypothetical protein
MALANSWRQGALRRPLICVELTSETVGDHVASWISKLLSGTPPRSTRIRFDD